MTLLQNLSTLYKPSDNLQVGPSHPLVKRLIDYWAIPIVKRAEHDNAPFWRSRKLESRIHFVPPGPEHPENHEALEMLLIQVILKFQTSDVQSVSTFRSKFLQSAKNVLASVALDARFPLLKLLCKHLPRLNIDLDSSSPPSDVELKLLKYDLAFLKSLPPRDARFLYERTMKFSRPEDLDTKGPRGYEFELLEVEWEAQDGEDVPEKRSFVLATTLLDEFKKRAHQGKEGVDRLRWAKLVVSVAIRTRDIDVVKEVVEWSQRYQGDPTVGQQLFGSILSESLRSCSTFCCSRFCQSRVAPLFVQLLEQIEKANSVLRICLEYSYILMQEPHFQAVCGPGGHLGKLLRAVLERRVEELSWLINQNIASENELVATLLETLMALILDHEKLIAQTPAEFNWATIQGSVYGMACPKSYSCHALTVLDRLAQARDEYWTQERIKCDPEVGNLEAGFPKGLPIQYLLPSLDWAALALEIPCAAPFASQRLENVLRSDDDSVLHVCRISSSVVGSCVDSLSFALHAHIARLSRQQQAERVVEIWNHYSQGILSTAEQQTGFRHWLISIAGSERLDSAIEILDPSPAPYIPPLDLFNQSWSSNSTIQWYPTGENIEVGDHHSATQEQTKADKATILQFRMASSTVRGPTISRGFSIPVAWGKPAAKPAASPSKIWSTTVNMGKLPLQTSEAVILSALLFLSETEKEPGLKSFPPNTIGPRYPNVSLAGPFVTATERESGAWSTAVRALKKLSPSVPSTLLFNLARSRLDQMGHVTRESSKFTILQRWVFDVVKLLTTSDKPQLSIDLFIQIFRELPDQSSWYRYFAPHRLGKRLTSIDACAFLENLAKFVLDGFGRNSLTDDEDARRRGSSVKITTVKMLANLLSRCDFVPQERALDLLCDIFSSISHIDVRTAVVSSILFIIRTQENSKNAFGALVSLVPIAAGPNENVILTEKEWHGAEMGGKLPNVADERRLTRLFTLQAVYEIPKRYREDYYLKL
jgi:hypothetical protein